MKGTMIVIPPGLPPVATELKAPPELEDLKKHVGGWIEKVPHFDSFRWPQHTAPRACVALCNEDGKRLQLGRNELADLYWCASLQADHGVLSCRPDFLVGTIVVLVGDAEFMEAL